MKLLGVVRRMMGSSVSPEIPTNSDLSIWVTKNDYPVLEAQVLLRMLDQTNRLRSIERLAGATPEVFDELYLAAIESFVEAAQLVPASVYDHHREPGGWIDHTLEVVENALQARKRNILPPGTKPEAIHEVEFVWTYAVFATALLHDAGKLLSLTHLKSLPFGDVWTPGGLTLREASISRYAVTWARYPYELQTVSSVALLGMLPKRGLSMLLGNQEVLRSMISTLTDDWQSGALGSIVSNADQESVRKYVAPGIEREGLPNIPVRPISQRLIRALRVEIDEGSIKLNTNGGGGWVKNDSVWLVCKVAVQRVRERLDSEGTYDVPDDERIYDILLDQGHIIPNLDPARQSIWYVSVKCPEYTHHLTMLRFERSTIIHRSKRVDEFPGEITVVSRDKMLALRAEAKTASRSAAVPVEKTKRTDTPSDKKPSTKTAVPPIEIDSSLLDDDDVEVQLNEASSVVEPPPTVDSPSLAGDQTQAHDESSAQAPPQPEKKKKTPVRRKGSARDAATAAVVAQINTRGKVDPALIKTGPVELGSEVVGRYFLTWVRESIDAGKPGFEVNDSEGNGLIHRISEGMFLVHPKIIQRFIIATGLVQGLPDGAEPNKNPDLKTAVDTVRKSLKKEKLLATTAKGYDVHQADVSNSKNPFVTGMLYGIVTPTWALYNDDELPPVNAAIGLWQGEYRTGSKIRPKADKSTKTKKET